MSLDLSYHAASAQSFKGGREHICLKFFSEYQIKQSSTWGELFAIQFALQSFTPKINNNSAFWETDNYATSLIVTSDSNRAHWYPRLTLYLKS